MEESIAELQDLLNELEAEKSEEREYQKESMRYMSQLKSALARIAAEARHAEGTEVAVAQSQIKRLQFAVDRRVREATEKVQLSRSRRVKRPFLIQDDD